MPEVAVTTGTRPLQPLSAPPSVLVVLFRRTTGLNAVMTKSKLAPLFVPIEAYRCSAG